MRIPGVPYVQGRNAYDDGDGKKYAVGIHCTQNDASDTDEAGYGTHRTDGTSSHLYGDKDSVTQSLDTVDKAGHAGSWQGNDHAIAVEITGYVSWSRQKWIDNVAWDKLGRALAVVCKHYRIAVRRATVAEMKANPKVQAFYGHDDMRRAWGGTTHTDPGPNFPWDVLFANVNKHMGTAKPPAPSGVKVYAISGRLPQLKYGMKDPAWHGTNYVWRLQVLMAWGKYVVEPDGVYGAKTAAAVKAYNKDVLKRNTDGKTVDDIMWKRLIAF